MSPKSLKITIFQVWPKIWPNIYFSPKSIFCSNFSIIQIFWSCATIFDHVQHFGHVQPAHDLLNCLFFLISPLNQTIHHVSDITLFIHIIKINVNSNYFELTSIVHIIGQKINQNFIFLSFSTISPKSMQIFPPTTIGEISRLIPAKFPAREKSSPIPVRI